MLRSCYSARWPLSTPLLVRSVPAHLPPGVRTIDTSGSGSFNAYAHRFFSPSYSFALSYNYWFNDAVSVASDLVAAQILLQFWTTWHPWVISVVFWVFLVGVNSIDVGAYGELGRTIELYISAKCN